MVEAVETKTKRCSSLLIDDQEHVTVQTQIYGCTRACQLLFSFSLFSEFSVQQLLRSSHSMISII